MQIFNFHPLRIWIVFLFSIWFMPAYADNEADSNRLFNWAEDHFPELFNPANQNTFVIDQYLVRFYENTDMYLGTSGRQVYLYSEEMGVIFEVGNIDDYL